jgi:hypothetical protein
MEGILSKTVVKTVVKTEVKTVVKTVVLMEDILSIHRSTLEDYIQTPALECLVLRTCV